MIKRFLIAFVLLVLIGGGLVGFNMFRDQAIEQFFANMPVAPLTVSVIEAKPADWTPAIGAIGTASAARGVDLTVETTGIVKEIGFSANQKVDEDAVLLRLDDAVQRADLDAARTQAALDQQALDRAIELQKRGVGTEAALEAARAAAAASAAQVTKLEAVVEQKRLRAPFSGTMGIPRIEAGQYIAPGTIVATLQDLDTMRADFTVAEQQFSSVRIGQPVRFGLGDGPMPFEGEIVGIDPKVDPASRLVAVRAEITNPDGKLTPGQFVQVEVQMPIEQDIIALPQTAVVTSLYGDYVFVVREKAAEPPAAAPAPAAGDTAPSQTEGKAPTLEVRQVFVKTGRRTQGLVEIASGVASGDRVVTAGQNRLSNGAPVVIDNTVDPSQAAPQETARQ
ncbi:MAG: efflux RND transporter periplasmic adaptor subunit [Rhizobiaceae bacterium]